MVGIQFNRAKQKTPKFSTALFQVEFIQERNNFALKGHRTKLIWKKNRHILLFQDLTAFTELPYINLTNPLFPPKFEND